LTIANARLTAPGKNVCFTQLVLEKSMAGLDLKLKGIIS
jgi:hypothetical protein